jgi:hypothetical protein
MIFVTFARWRDLRRIYRLGPTLRGGCSGLRGNRRELNPLTLGIPHRPTQVRQKNDTLTIFLLAAANLYFCVASYRDICDLFRPGLSSTCQPARAYREICDLSSDGIVLGRVATPANITSWLFGPSRRPVPGFTPGTIGVARKRSCLSKLVGRVFAGVSVTLLQSACSTECSHVETFRPNLRAHRWLFHGCRRPFSRNDSVFGGETHDEAAFGTADWCLVRHGPHRPEFGMAISEHYSRGRSFRRLHRYLNRVVT